MMVLKQKKKMMSSKQSIQPDYQGLTPDVILDAIQSVGIMAEAALLTLNSYENRVFQFRDIESNRWVAKFYRPHRWSDAQILEEHQFSINLTDLEIPVVPPLTIASQTLFCHQGFRFSVFPCQGGREPNLDDRETLTWIGRFIARIHNVGCLKPFQYRQTLSIDNMGKQSVSFISSSDFVPTYLQASYQAITSQLLEICVEIFNQFNSTARIRLHGDCHPGNILWTDDGPHFVDFDDCIMGPEVQDLWMLLSGDEDEQKRQKDAIMDGYESFREFDYRQWRLIEPLRTLRMLHYSAWLGRRWDDPAFKHHFPWFDTNNYWEEQILMLKEQLAVLQQNNII